MRYKKPSGRNRSGYSKHGKSWLTRGELMHMRWYQEVKNSKQNRGDKSPINVDD